MDGAESDCSESYFSACESSLQAKGERSSVVSAAEDSGKSSTEQYSNVQKMRGGETQRLREEGMSVRRTPLISKDSGNKTINVRRRRVRHNSETTKVRDSFVITHALSGMNTLYVLWANDKLCDTIVTVEGKEFPAHSVVLATHSDYFLSLLLKETTGASLPRRISIDGLVSAPGFGRLLGYMYTSEIDLRWGNVCTTMQTANSLSVARVVELGREFLQTYNIESCLNALIVSRQANLASLHANIRHFVLDNFMAVSLTKGFLKCPAETLASIMTDDSVNVDSELDILLAAKTWISHNGQDGLKSAPLLIKEVRFHYIPSEDLEKYVEGDDQLMRIPEVKSKVMTVYSQRTPSATTSGTSERSRKRSKEKTSDDDVHKPLLTSARLSRDRLHTSESPPQNEADTLHEVNLVSQTPTPGTSSASSIPVSQPQPEPPTKAAQPLTKTSQTRSASTNVSHSVHSEVLISKEANLTTQTPAGIPLGEVASAGKTSSSRPGGVSKSGQHPPVKKTKSPEPWPMPQTQTAHGVNMALKSPKTPRKNVTKYFAPRLVSDYRLTASNPKALASGPIAWPVTPKAKKERRPDVIITVGGVAKSGESEVMGRLVEAFLLDENEWREMTQLPAARNHHVAHYLDGFVYVVGGSDPHADGDDFLKPVKSVLKYDVRSGQWSEAQPMDSARIFHEVTALFGQLYVVGGQDHAGRTLATVECYSPSTDRWRYVASLPSPRYGMAVTVYRGQLWVAGGFPEDRLAETSKVPTDVVCYNVFRDEWNLVTPLRIPRCHTSLLEMADRLYMIGGFVGDSSESEEKNQSLSTIEMFDERKDEWVFVADLWQGRHDANTVTVGDKAYIIGGMDDENEDPLPNIECFDPIAMSWSAGMAALPSARFGHACCVIPGDARIEWAKS